MQSATFKNLALPALVGTAILSTAILSTTPRPAGAASPEQIQEAAARTDVSADRPALTEHFVEIQPGIFVAVKGSRDRRLVRYARWVQLLDGDRLAVYEEEGYPVYRHYVREMGTRTEIWNYREKGISYVFRDGNLIETRLY
jgi:hypothetical protein